MFCLLENEHTIYSIPELSLTNFRVIYTQDEMNRKEKHTILLKNIVSCQVTLKRNRVLFLIFVLLGVASIYTGIALDAPQNIGLSIVLAFSGLLFFGAYFNKKPWLYIRSANSVIAISVDLDNAIDFIEHLDAETINQNMQTIKKKLETT